MTARSMSRMVMPLMAFVAASTVALVLIIQSVRHEPPVNTEAVSAGPPKLAPCVQKHETVALAAAQSEVKAGAEALASSPARPDSGYGIPTFDIARIEPTGEAVIAGRAE